MNVVELTRQLVDIESISGHEAPVADFVLAHLGKLAASSGGRAERMEVAGDRFNVLACWGKPLVTLSTHLDTVPPFYPSREDAGTVRGRGSCDAKGILAAMVVAAEKLAREGVKDFGLLFVVGEERDSAGAAAAARSPRGSRFLVNGEPTQNQLAVASKGALRFEVAARGKTAHSAYPELGESAIDALLDALAAIRRVPLPEDPILGRCTMNIGTLQGGRAPNVVADEARAELLVRLVGDPAPLRESFAAAVGRRAGLREVLCIPAMTFERLEGLATTVVSFTTDIPVLSPAWGKPLLIGPGSIHCAHTADESVPKAELEAAVGIYADIVRRLRAAP
jgi:acetylornithine deacetylase